VTRILVVEDERDLALGIRANLEIEGYEVAVAPTGEAALEEIARASPDVIILDLMLPGMSGYDVLARLRQQGSDVLVLILSARGEEIDKVRGFRTGADDYVSKPFGVMELIARIHALLRRRLPAGPAFASAPKIGDAMIDVSRRALIRDGVEIALTPKELELLLALCRKPDRIVTRQDLLREVWGYAGDVTSRTVDVHIAELRRKIEDDPAHPRHIVTVWRAGYRLRA
jgi:two-component system, OmpR family, alkaline phosphatase synthesis response regulator PhoP